MYTAFLKTLNTFGGRDSEKEGLFAPFHYIITLSSSPDTNRGAGVVYRGLEAISLKK